MGIEICVETTDHGKVNICRQETEKQRPRRSSSMVDYHDVQTALSPSVPLVSRKSEGEKKTGTTSVFNSMPSCMASSTLVDLSSTSPLLFSAISFFFQLLPLSRDAGRFLRIRSLRCEVPGDLATDIWWLPISPATNFPATDE